MMAWMIAHMAGNTLAQRRRKLAGTYTRKNELGAVAEGVASTVGLAVHIAMTMQHTMKLSSGVQLINLDTVERLGGCMRHTFRRPMNLACEVGSPDLNRIGVSIASATRRSGTVLILSCTVIGLKGVK